MKQQQKEKEKEEIEKRRPPAFKKIILIGGLTILVVLAVGIYWLVFSSRESKDWATVTFKNPAGEFKVNAEIVQTQEERKKGLSGRSNLPQNQGMLFVFPNTVKPSFWMKDTLIPLDLIFISPELAVVDIKENFEPCDDGFDCPSYTSPNLAKYVLEVNGGYVENKGIDLGNRIKIDF